MAVKPSDTGASAPAAATTAAAAAAATAAPQSPPNADSEADEAGPVASLARLQELHIQLRRLRDTVPSLLRPIQAEHASPERTYAEFAEAAMGAVNNVREFSGLMGEPQSRRALASGHAPAPVAGGREQPDNVMGWLVTQHADWAERPASGPGAGSVSAVEMGASGGTMRKQAVNGLPHMMVDDMDGTGDGGGANMKMETVAGGRS